MHLANLSLGRAGKEADNWCAEQCHCVVALMLIRSEVCRSNDIHRQ